MNSSDFLGKFRIQSSVVLLCLLLLLVGGMFLYANSCGLGFTYDSHIYLKIANQIGSDGFLNAEGFRVKPPIYPLIIHWVGKESLATLNLICLLLSTCVLFYFGLNLKAGILKIIYFLLLAFATPHYYTHSFAWTEPLFIAVLLMAFLFYYMYEKKSMDWSLYLSLILFLLLPFIRFSGILIIVPLFAFILFNGSQKVRNIMLSICLIGIIIIGFWVLRNIDGFLGRWNTLLMPFNSGSPDRYLHNLDSYLEGFSIWLLPLFIYKPIRMLLAVLVLVLITLYVIRQFRKGNISMWTVGIPSTFVCYYVILHPIFHVEYYTAERYLTPLYGLLIFTALRIIDKNWETKNRLFRVTALSLIIYLAAYNSVRTAKNVMFWHNTRCETLSIHQ